MTPPARLTREAVAVSSPQGATLCVHDEISSDYPHGLPTQASALANACGTSKPKRP